jgi:hypothetical protein
MKAILSALMAICLIATPVLAWSNIRTYYSASGFSYLNEYTSIAGYDYSEQSIKDTAFVHEVVINNGDITLGSEIRTTGAWELQEDKQIQGDGFTNIRKDVVWWTEDPTENNGELIYPTKANIYTLFQTETFTDATEIHSIANQPPAETENVFSRGWTTNEAFQFTESVGINKDLRCDLELPRPIRMPSCIFNCQV